MTLYVLLFLSLISIPMIYYGNKRLEENPEDELGKIIFIIGNFCTIFWLAWIPFLNSLFK